MWVGGQIVMLGLVPAARRLGAGAPRRLARAFARLSWPAYAVLVVTGFWNVSTFHFADQTTAWKVVLAVKIAVVALAGLAAFLHSRATLQGRPGRLGGDRRAAARWPPCSWGSSWPDPERTRRVPARARRRRGAVRLPGLGLT